MLRYRRYRVFVVFAVFAIFGFYYHFASSSGWQPAAAIGVGSLRNFGLLQNTKPAIEDVSVAKQTEKPGVREADVQEPLVNEAPIPTTQATLLDVAPVAKLTTKAKAATTSTSTSTQAQAPIVATATSAENAPLDVLLADNGIQEGGQGRLDVTASVRKTTIHWSQQSENFPVSSTIALPTGKPTTIPKIQHKFGRESTTQQEERLEKLKVIKDAAVFSWQGYKEHAWKHDEIKPETGGKRDPFCGWAATLVDALDTLWIMGMKDEFDEAVKAVGEIDFTTSPRKDIPLFETTIRYLGGMLAAYDVSGGAYKVLLDKSVELAEVLMGAFDTPNRMPMTFYHWMPAFSSQPHRAMTRVVLAEIGSLSMEFTRLAQLTKRPKYYDAIARITDAFEEWQSRDGNGTMLPGLFPTFVDASGCEKPAQIKTSANRWNTHPQDQLVGDGNGQSPVGKNPEKAIPFSGDRVKKPEAASPAGIPAKLTADESSPVGLNPEKAIPVSGDRPKNPEGYAAAAGEPVKLAAGSKQEVPDPDRLSDSFQPGKPGTGKIAGWGNPIREGDLDSKENKEKLLAGKASELGSLHQKRQLGGELSEKVQDGKSENTGSISAMPEKAPHMRTSTSGGQPPEQKAGSSSNHPQGLAVCIESGLTSSSKSGSDKFGLGSMADSTYEYLPKQFILLGGLEIKYRTIYEKAMDTATEYLLYRPMTPNNEDILFAGEWRARIDKDGERSGQLHPEGAHLTCFAGGMYALGAKIFNRPEDLEIGRKLTQGCVWAYSSTATGIMPEGFELLPCKDKENCVWDEQMYHSALDPNEVTRTKFYTPPAARATATATQTRALLHADEILSAGSAPVRGAEKRDAASQDAVEALNELAGTSTTDNSNTIPHPKPGQARTELDGPVPPSNANTIPRPKPGHHGAAAKNYAPPLSHKDYVAARIKDERLPVGMTKITSRKYILRPEAIESVWYMYRITGEEHWRKVGWEMFTAINEHTRARYGNSAINDVTKPEPELLDEEESFWLAETLKYFFLLFSTEDVISLDDWVLNTEAHPFRRPDYEG